MWWYANSYHNSYINHYSYWFVLLLLDQLHQSFQFLLDSCLEGILSTFGFKSDNFHTYEKWMKQWSKYIYMLLNERYIFFQFQRISSKNKYLIVNNYNTSLRNIHNIYIIFHTIWIANKRYTSADNQKKIPNVTCAHPSKNVNKKTKLRNLPFKEEYFVFTMAFISICVVFFPVVHCNTCWWLASSVTKRVALWSQPYVVSFRKTPKIMFWYANKYIVFGIVFNNSPLYLTWSRNYLPFRSTWVLPRFLVGFVLLDLWFYVYVCPFVYFLLAIVLSARLRYKDSDYPFGIFKLFI